MFANDRAKYDDEVNIYLALHAKGVYSLGTRISMTYIHISCIIHDTVGTFSR